MNIIDTGRENIRSVMYQEARFLNWASGGRITANHVTWTSLLFHLPIAWAIIEQRFTVAALLLLVFGLLDAVDGQLARLQNKSSNYGVFLDSSTDRIKESLVYGPLVYVFAEQTRPEAALLAAAALSGALITGYIRARGESVIQHTAKSASEANQIFKGGFARFEIRLAIMFLGLLAEQPLPAVAFIAVSAWLTTVFRMGKVIRALKADAV